MDITIICMKAICHLGCDDLCIHGWFFCWASLPFLANGRAHKKSFSFGTVSRCNSSRGVHRVSFIPAYFSLSIHIPILYPVDQLQLLLRDSRVQNNRVLSLHIEAKRDYFLRIARQFQSHVDNARKHLPPESIQLRCTPPKSTSVHTTDIVWDRANTVLCLVFIVFFFPFFVVCTTCK